jgi:hypothetical protein
MTKHLHPPLESNKRKVGPKDGKEAVNKEDCKPLVVPNNLQELDLPFFEDASAGCN